MTDTHDRPLALVTGGSAGIGYEIATLLVGDGHDVLITGSSDRVHSAAARLGEHGVAVMPVQSDLATAEGVDAVWEAVSAIGRPLDVAVLNAGIAVGGAFTEIDLDRHLQLIALNVIAPVRLAYLIVPQMTTAGRGRILFVSSLSATTPTPFETVYGPSKSFLTSFAHSLREEIRGSGVSITTLHPGATATEFHARAGMGNTKFGDNSWKNSPGLVAQQGYTAMRNGVASIIGGDRQTKRAGLINRLLSDESKARRQARFSRDR